MSTFAVYLKIFDYDTSKDSIDFTEDDLRNFQDDALGDQLVHQLNLHKKGNYELQFEKVAGPNPGKVFVKLVRKKGRESAVHFRTEVNEEKKATE